MLRLDKLKKFLKLSGKEKLWFLKAIIALPLTYFGLRMFGLKRCQVILGRLGAAKKEPEAADIAFLTNRLSGLIMNAANNGLFRANCLPRSLTLWWFLRRHGIQSELHFGMQKENDQIKGHAWIERHGKVLNDDSDALDRFVRLGNLQDFQNS
jgi:Transglutaminase-like superfamily